METSAFHHRSNLLPWQPPTEPSASPLPFGFSNSLQFQGILFAAGTRSSISKGQQLFRVFEYARFGTQAHATSIVCRMFQVNRWRLPNRTVFLKLNCVLEQTSRLWRKLRNTTQKRSPAPTNLSDGPVLGGSETTIHQYNKITAQNSKPFVVRR